MDGDRRFILVTHGTFFLTGIVTTMLGPLLPELIRLWELTDSQAGGLFLAQSLGSMAGILASSRVMLRLGFLYSLSVGAGFMTAGVAGITLPLVVGSVTSIVIYGVGLGITIPSVNLLIAHRFPQRRAAALNLLNLCWCVGAVVSPPIIAWCLLQGLAAFFLWGLALLLAGSLLCLLRERQRDLSGPRAVPAPRSDEFLADAPRILIALLLFLYVSSEIGTAGWIPTYAQRLGIGELTWSWLQSSFWGFLLLGRAVSPGMLRRIEPPLLVLAGLMTALAGEILFLSSLRSEMLFVGVALAGLGLSIIYPTTIAVFSEFYGEQASARSTPIFAMASLGGAIGPWIIGFSSEQLGSLRGGMTLLILAIVLMLAIQFRLVTLWKEREPSSGSAESFTTSQSSGSSTNT